MSTKKGFTLIEILIVVSIITILALIGMLSYTSFQRNARDTKRQSDLRLIQAALERYHADQKYYPVTLGINGEITGGYDGSLKGPLPAETVYLSVFPKDPVSTGSYLYKSYKPDKGEDGKFTGECVEVKNCFRYCLYTKLEDPAPDTEINECPQQEGYNFSVTSPK